MANMELITSVTVGSGGAASVTLPATGTIPATYTDLKVSYSARVTQASIAVGISFTFNASTSNFSSKILYGNGSSAASFSSARYAGSVPGSTATASTFSNNEVYIPNYTSSNYKSYSVDTVTENNATESYAYIAAGLWSDTAALTSLTLTPDNGNFVEGSTFYLYGISNVTSGSKATGGIVSSDGTYWYHMFPFSGTFTPTTAISADYLIVGGGGGGGTFTGGGGGAGGLVYQTGQTLTATGYSVVIGAGGAGAVGTSSQTGTMGVNGVDSTFNSKTATGGGGGSIWQNSSQKNGASGGSGGGGGENAGAGTGGASTQNSYSGTGFGNAGGNGIGTSPYGGGGGGGAGAVGAACTSVGGGNGGIGKQYLDFANATQTGANNGYYAGGGGGVASAAGYSVGVGGLGGGGSGVNTAIGTAGTANTGGGGGAGFGGNNAATQYGGNGGSGIVIIRYAI